jgi:hypothetical protein
MVVAGASVYFLLILKATTKLFKKVYSFYDGAFVLLRRLVETLLIECYEHEKSQFRIADSDGNYFMLSGIIADAVDKSGLSLGRETKSVLRELKALAIVRRITDDTTLSVLI